MEYRVHPKTGDKIGVIGLGTGPIFETPEKEAVAALTYAHEQGVNYVDFATAGGPHLPVRRGGVRPGAPGNAVSSPFWGQLPDRGIRLDH